jgi:DNA-binding Lrp family transcriptional regulator
LRLLDGAPGTEVSRNSREHAVARLSVCFLLDQVTTGVGGLATRDALLMMAINQANIAPLTRDPEARSQYGGLDRPAPDTERRPVSINAVAASLGLPFETARRRIRNLAERQVCVLTKTGVVVPESYLTSPAYLHSVQAAHARLWAFYAQLQLGSLLDPLPASAYHEDDIPVRGAARLLADYLLRETEHLMRLTGDVISSMVLLALLEVALLGPGRGISLSRLALRLDIPDETIRRHTGELRERGFCERGANGLTVPEAALASAPLAGFMRDNGANVQRLFAGLAERGVIEAWALTAAAVQAEADAARAQAS